VVGTDTIIGLITSWSIVKNWLLTKYSIYVGGTTSCSGIGYTFLGT
jgi:hypothetical protein